MPETRRLADEPPPVSENTQPAPTAASRPEAATAPGPASGAAPEARPIHRVTVVLPAYNAARTLERTYNDIPKHAVDDIILVDDASHDETVEKARQLGIHVIVHPENRGYGGNQKTCYTAALHRGAEVIVMVHPDYQYDPRVLPDLIAPILSGRADVVFGSRLATRGGALAGGMPLYKFIGNRFLTTVENIVFGRNMSEYHTGLRAYSRRFLESIPFMRNSDGFGFDSEVVGQIVTGGYRLEEIPVETRYFREASSVNLKMSVLYGLKTLSVCSHVLWFRLRKLMGLGPGHI